MLDPSDEGRREGLRIRNPGSNTAAPVRLVADLDTIHTDRAFSRVELGGVLEAPEAALVHLLGDPAFVPDVRVTAALVERGEYALHLGRQARATDSQGRSAWCLSRYAVASLMLTSGRPARRGSKVTRATCRSSSTA